MDSLAFKEIMVGFSRSLQRTDEDLSSAADGDMTKEEAKQAIAAGREKLKEYEGVLKKLAGEPVKKKQFETRYAESVQSIRDALERLA